MTDPHEKQLAEQLRSLTTWHGPRADVWREALKKTRGRAARSHSALHRFLHTPVPKWALGAAAVIAIMVSLQLVLGPSLGLDRMSSVPSVLSDESNSMHTYSAEALTGGGSGGIAPGRAAPHDFQADGEARGADDLVPADQRQVVRKATVELSTNDVQAAFMKASLLISEARGEYVEESSLTGSGKDAQAHIKLRVAADRLSEVLNQLRELGEVVSEKSGGEDITTQVVDLEARLRNEHRIEKELLELLENREDAPLKEVLELRQHIASVRQQIERLTAQRTQMERLVSLATVLVLIRSEDAPEKLPADGSLGSYFSESIQIAWQKGLLFLADTVALLLRVLVGGLIWWILLLAVLLRVWQHHRASAAGQ